MSRCKTWTSCQLSADGLRQRKRIGVRGTQRRRHQSPREILDQREYLARKEGLGYKTLPEKQLQKNRQVGRGNPPAGLLVSRKGTGRPAVGSLHTMFLMKPAESRRVRRLGRRSRGWRTGRRTGTSLRTSGRRVLDGGGELRSPRTGRSLGAGRNQVHLKRVSKIIGEKIHSRRRNPALVQLVCFQS